MSISLKSIIQDLYIGKVLKFVDAQHTSIPEKAGTILVHLYEYHKNHTLSPESIIFLETTNSISHIISILNRIDRMDLDRAIEIEVHEILKKGKKHEPKITLLSIIEHVLYDEFDQGKITAENKDKILESVLEHILTARVNGELDEDTRKLINQPDHEDLIFSLLDRLMEGDDLVLSMKDLYQALLAREHHFLDEVARDDDISEVKERIENTERVLNETLMELRSHLSDIVHASINHQFGEVHKHLDHIGKQSFEHIKSVKQTPPVDLLGVPTRGNISNGSLRLDPESYETNSRIGRSTSSRQMLRRNNSNRPTYHEDEADEL